MKVQYAGQTDVGLKRGHNEDSFFLMAEQNLYMVADGMGGHSAGEVASRMAVDTIAQFFRDSAEDDDVTWPFKMDKGISYEENRLATGIKLANLRINEQAAANPKQKGMGTTLVSAHFVRNGVIVGHVGDSRCYRWRASEFKQLTEDHSLLNDYIKMKDLTPEEIENFPHKNVIVRALGMKETVQVDVFTVKPEIGDIFLLCTDGLSGLVPDPELNEIMGRNADSLEKCGAALIEAANRHGGNDNITALLIKVIGD